MSTVIAVDETYVPEGCWDPQSVSFYRTCFSTSAFAYAYFARLMWPHNHTYRAFTNYGSLDDPRQAQTMPFAMTMPELDHRNDTLLGSLALGEVETEMASYALTPERVGHLFAVTSPVEQSQPSLYYSALLNIRRPPTLLEGLWLLLKAWPPILLIISLVCWAGRRHISAFPLNLRPGVIRLVPEYVRPVYFTSVVQGPSNILTLSSMSPQQRSPSTSRSIEMRDSNYSPLAQNQVQSHHPLERSFSQHGHRLTLMCWIPLTAARLAFSLNTTGRAMDFLHQEFGTSMYFVDYPLSVFMGILPRVIKEHPCVKEAMWMRQFLSPRWSGIIFREEDGLVSDDRRDRAGSETLERANLFVGAITAMDKQYARKILRENPEFQLTCEGLDKPAAAYRRLGTAFIRDSALLLLAVPLFSLPAFLAELIVPCYGRRTMSFV